MKRYKLEQRSANDERKMWESDRGEWIKYADIEEYIEYADRVTIGDMESKAARIRNVLDSLMGDAKKLYLLKSKLSE